MKKYRVKKEFMIESIRVSVMFSINSKWDYVGYSDGYIRLHRNGVFIDIPKAAVERNFDEVKAQRGE